MTLEHHALTAEHRRWRIKIFGATWLTYVGFYFCRKPFSAAKSAIGLEFRWDATVLGNIWAAYLIAYAIGQFLASALGTQLGPRRNVMMGMALSIAVTFAMGMAPDPWLMGGLAAVNGIAQATGWSGNVGTMAAWFNKHERGRVMGLWSTNFTTGSIVSGLVMAAMLAMRDVWLRISPTDNYQLLFEPAPWRTCFFLGAFVLLVIALQFVAFQRNRPEDVGLAPIADAGEPATNAPVGDRGLPKLSPDAWINLLLVGGFYFFAKSVRYAVWSWTAFFLVRNFGKSEATANAYSIVFDLMGVPGVYLTGWISDRFLGSRRAGISLVMMIGMTVSTGLLVWVGGESFGVFVVLLGAVGFTLYGPDALLTGAGAMDIGGRRAATFAAAMISGFGSLGPVVQEVVIPRVYNQKSAQEAGNLGPVFGLLFGSALLATVFCAILVWRNRRGKGV